MILTFFPERDTTTGELVISFDRPRDVGAVHARGIKSVAFHDDDEDPISVQRPGTLRPAAREVSRIVIREIAPHAVGPVAVHVLDPRPNDTGPRAIAPAWMEE